MAFVTQLEAKAVDEYVNYIETQLATGVDGGALEATLRTFDADPTSDVNKARLKQVLIATKNSRTLTNGQVDVTLSSAGTGYSVGDKIPVTGDGVGAYIIVDSVDIGGAIQGFQVVSGEGYTTASVDTTGVGNEDATFTTTVSNELKAVDDAIALIDGATGGAMT